MKRKLRILAREELLDSGKMFHRHYIDRVTYKMKTLEFGKPGKYPRMIGDMGVAASLQGFRVTEILKHALTGPIVHRNCTYYFVGDASAESLNQAFRTLVEMPTEYVFLCFSDDAVMGHRGPGGVRYMNLDISSCDASHTRESFQLVQDVAGPAYADAIRVLTEQCEMPILLTSVEDRRRRVVLRPVEPRLYSGSTLTTLINTLASMTIALAITQHPYTAEGIVAAASKAGYIVTVDWCDRLEDVQFLKRSPTMINGEVRHLLNAGVFFRSSGMCHGDLPGRGDYEQRARAFQRGLISSFFPGVDVPWVNRMRTEGRVILQDDRFLKSSDPVSLSNEHFFRRYQLTESELEELVDGLSQCDYSTSFECAALDKIFLKDYGLRCCSAA